MKKSVFCPKCKSSNIVKRGLEKQKSGSYQRYLCQNCLNNFTSKKLENSTYSPRVIMQALCNYNNGMSLEESSLAINKRFGVKTYPRLVSSWLKKFEDICSFKRFRKSLGKFSYKNSQMGGEVIFKKEFEHKLPYLYQYHKKKLELFINKYFLDLKYYLEKIPEKCPNKLFNEDNYRCSQMKFCRDLEVIKRDSIACKISEFALKCIRNNYERHDFVEEFLINNDSSTIAVEVPVWLYPSEVPPELKGILNLDKPLTGHIDVLQLRYGLIHVLDFKPQAHKEKPEKVASQLFAYSVALSVRTGKWLRNFKCAWFDDKNYYEFSPAEIVLKHLETSKNDKYGKYSKNSIDRKDGKEGKGSKYNKNTSWDDSIIKKYKLNKGANRYYTSKKYHSKRFSKNGGKEKTLLEKIKLGEI